MNRKGWSFMEKERLLKCLGQAPIYDIKNEFRDFGTIGKKQTNLERYNAYQRYISASSVGEQIRCENGLLAVTVYGNCYPYLKGFRKRKQEAYTPNYFQYNYMYELYNKDVIYSGFVMNSFDIINRCDGMDDEFLRLVDEYAAIVHSCGNMLPVPKFFAEAVMKKFGGTYSWFDIIKSIFAAYTTNDDKRTIYVPALKALLFVDDENIEVIESTLLRCIDWLEHFRDENGLCFDQFVIQNKLECYCEKDEEEHYAPLQRTEYDDMNYDRRKINIKGLIEVITKRNQELLKVIKSL